MNKILKKLSWPAVIILSAVSAGVLAVMDRGGTVRTVISFWFILVCPGMAIIGLLRLKDDLMELVLAVALSLALTVLITEVMAFANYWHPALGLGILIAISLAGAFLQVLRAAPVQLRPYDNHH